MNDNQLSFDKSNLSNVNAEMNNEQEEMPTPMASLWYLYC